MVLTECQFEFFSDRELFQLKNNDILSDLNNKVILGIYGVWDNIFNEWFDDAPMLIEYEAGTIAINIKSEHFLSVTANVITPNDKPQWFGNETILKMHAENFMWEEDLEWKQYGVLSEFLGSKIISVELIEESNGLLGLLFKTNKENFVIVDNGDVIAGFSEYEWKAM